MMNKTVFHIDVNNAFLSWSATELLKEDNSIDLRIIPSVIGGDYSSRRGIVLAKSIPAKRYGIVTGEPLASALRKCPSLKVIPPNFSLYKNCSEKLFNLLSAYSDRIEVFSIDECFLDYTGMERLFGSPMEAAHRIKQEIKEKLKFTVNIGIGPNKLLAKMAGELEKPDKVITINLDEVKEKLWPLPVSDLFMVGRKTAPKLNRMGIFTIGQLANYDYSLLEREFKSYAYVLKNYANGISDDDVASCEYKHVYKSVGNSTTTLTDIKSTEEAHKVLLALAQSVGYRLRGKGQFAEGISITLKTNEFITYSKRCCLNSPTDSTKIIYETAVELFNKTWKKEPLRLLGISCERLTYNHISQIGILDYDNEKQRKAELAIDKINSKPGTSPVTYCTLLNSNLKISKGSPFTKD